MLAKAKSIVRTLFANHCVWADVLIVRERCFDSHRNCFRANIALENLLWNCSKMRRPYVVYQEGDVATNNCDPVPDWPARECVYRDFCQCHLLGDNYQGWCRPGALYSNVVCSRFQLFDRRCDCIGDAVMSESPLPWNYHNRNAKNSEIATGLSRIVLHVLEDAPPSVPPRGEPMVCVLTSRVRTPVWEPARHNGIQRRYLEKLYRKDFRWMLIRDYRLERERRIGYIVGGDGGESSEEENIA